VYGALRLPGLDPDNPVQMGPGFFVDNWGKRSASLDLKVRCIYYILYTSR
jgi:hypothetical protein